MSGYGAGPIYPLWRTIIVFEPSEAEREGESVRYQKELRFGDLEVIAYNSIVHAALQAENPLAETAYLALYFYSW